MNSTGRIDFAFVTGLVGCIRDDIEDVELQVAGSFQTFIELKVGGRRSPIFIVLWRPWFLKLHKRD